MKKKKLSLLISTGAALLGATAISAATAVSLASCTSTTSGYDKSIAKQLYNAYNSEYSAAMGDQMYYQLTAENQPKVTTITQNYLSKVNSVINAVGETFGLDEQIWLRSFKFYLQTKLKLLQSNIRYVIVDSSDMLSMTNYATTFQSQISKAASNYYSSSGDALSYDTVTANLNGVNQYINEILANLKEGLADGTTWSGVMAKHTIGSILQQLYAADLGTWAAKDESTRGDLKSVLTGTLFTSNETKDKWLKTLSDTTQQSKINTLLTTVQTSLDTLTKYLMNDYFSGIKYGNEYKTDNDASTNGTMSLEYSVSTSKKPSEEDNGFSYTSGSTTYYISGLGLSANDLTVKDIGIGFSSTNGQAIYKALLQKHSNVEDADPAEQYKFGNGQVESILTAMKSVASTIANIQAGTSGEWKPEYYYDKDSSGDEYGSTLVNDSTIRNSSGTIDMTAFFQWLNGDQWFNGRDMTKEQFPSLDGTSELEATGETNVGTTNKTAYTYTPYWTNKDLVASVIGYKGDTDADTTTTWGDAGNLYVKYITKGLSAATIQSSSTITAASMTNDINAAAAYIGSSHAVAQYLTYKNDVTPHITGAFKTTPIYWTLRSGVGGAAYASSGEGQSNWVDEGYGGFYLDSNPYFGLQKWSMSTLTNHEAVSGHVLQFAYAAAHPADSDAISLESTAYAEGWGLFSEWFATQVGIYGEPTQASVTLDSSNNITATNNVLTLPKFGTNSQTTNVTLLSSDYANGAYYIADKSTSSSNATKANSQKYYDALQYFGFLNERQLRAMRVAVDVGLHAGINGDFAAGTGYSLSEARAYLRSNSGLGIDDVNRETKRYLEYIGQATSYYNGLDKMQSYFLKAKALYEKANPKSTYMNWEDTASTQANTQDLFDLILRNNDVQLPALTWAVDKYLSEKYPTTSTTSL